MRYAIFSDIHGNRPAWEAVLADMKALETDVYVCLGDIVGYGPKPREVLDGIRGVTSNFVIGNHDAAAVGILDASIFNDQARAVIEWTRNQLDEESVRFLSEMPLVIEDEDIMFVHAEVEEPGRFLYIDSEEEARDNFEAGDHKIVFVGHTHNPGIFVRNPDGSVQRLPDEDGILEEDSRYIVNVGSVGEPRNPDDIRARYVIYDDDTNAVSFRRIKFDVERYRAELDRSGLDVTPYFMRVVDHYQEAVAQQQAAAHAMMVDMQTPAITPLKMSKASRRLVVPTASAQMNRPKPRLTPPAKKKSPTVVAVSIAVIAVATIGGIIWSNLGGGDDTEELVVGDEERVIGPGDGDPEAGGDGGGSSPGSDSGTGSVTTEARNGFPPGGSAERGAPPSDGPFGYWNFDKGDSAMERPSMLLMTAGKTADPLVDPVPWTGASNAGSAWGGSWLEEKPSGWFALRADRSFTFECWVSGTGSDKDIEFIAGDRTDTNEGFRGWHLASGLSDPGAFHFVFDPGAEESVEISVPDEDYFDEKPHHLALVWDHDGIGESAGLVRIYVDGLECGSAKIAHEQIPAEPSVKKFCLGDRLTDQDNRFEGKLDEARFSGEALEPALFLSAVGEEAKPPAPKPGAVKGSKAMAGKSKAKAKGPPPPPKPPPTPPKPPVDPPYPMEDVAGLGEGLIFYAPFDEKFGSKTAWDFSGSGRHFPLAGVKLGEAGQVGTAIKIERRQLTTAVRPLEQLPGASISLWIKNAAPQRGRATAGHLVTVQQALATTLQRFTIQANMDASGQGARASLAQNPKWYHVFIENNGTNSTIFINRVKKNTHREGLKQTGTIDAAIVIGSNAANFSLDEVAIWNRTLSDGEKKEVFQRGQQGTPILSPARVIAHWKMDDARNSRIMADEKDNFPLGSYRMWTPFEPIAPDPVPLTRERNKSAARIFLLGEQPDNAGTFALGEDRAFTFEGWFHAGNQKAATLGSTMGTDGGGGWRVALLRGDGQNGFVAFMYENGEKKVQALGRNLKIFDNRPHHFAAVWEPKAAADAGRLSIFIDNKQAGAAMLPHADIAPGPGSPFQVGSSQNELTVDELRFSATALRPGLFLTAGRKPEQETVPRADKPVPGAKGKPEARAGVPSSPTPGNPVAAAPSASTPGGEIVQFDFEGDSFDGWKVEGTAFGSKPAGVGLTGNKALSGQVGNKVVHSSHGADGPTGKLTSDPFKISKRYLRLLIAGGPHRGKTYVGLLVDGKLVHSTTGQENLDFREVLWDVSSFANKEAQLVVVDDFTGRWGMIACDHVVQTGDAGNLKPVAPSP